MRSVVHVIKLGASELRMVLRHWLGSRQEAIEDITAWTALIAGAVTVLATAATVLVDILGFHGIGR